MLFLLPPLVLLLIQDQNLFPFFADFTHCHITFEYFELLCQVLFDKFEPTKITLQHTAKCILSSDSNSIRFC